MKTKFLLLLCGLLCTANLNAQTWKCGKNVTATLSNGTLTISGEGAMKKAAWNKNAIRAVIINDGVTSIGDNAFESCGGLTSVTIGNSVTSIGSAAFENCGGLISVIIGSSVTSIGKWAFKNCRALTSVTIGNSVTTIGSNAFESCSGLTSVTVPNSVTSIGNTAFENCRGLISVTIGSSVAFIGNWAFKNCISLTSITILRSVPPAVESYTFDRVNNACCLYVPSQEASVRYKAAYDWKIFSCVYTVDGIKMQETVVVAETPRIDTPSTPASKSSNVSKSEVDVNIPATGAKNDNAFAVILANENYRREKRVEFAHNDGTIFKEYCIKTLGLPEKNVSYVADATLNDIRAEVSWLSQVAKAYSGKASIIFYYAGHGIPDENSKSAYLLPVDGYGSDARSGYKLDDLYKELGSVPAKRITVFIDACFSGAQRSGDMLASARGVAVKTKPSAPVGNMVVFSAAQGDETAYPYREKGHGLFTYFLLKKLQESKGNVTLSELENYLTTNVKQQSIVVNRKGQTPTVTPSRTLGFAWEDWKLK